MINHPKLANLSEPRFVEFLKSLDGTNFNSLNTGLERLVLADDSEIHMTDQVGTVIFYFYRFDIKNKRYNNRDKETQYISLYYCHDPSSGRYSVLYSAEELEKPVHKTTKEDFFNVIMRKSEFMAEWLLFNPIL